MKEGWYENPINKVNHSAKVAVVLGTFVGKGQTEEVPARRRVQPFLNNQEEFTFVENKFDLLKFNLACHQRYNAGVDYELIIVDNSSTDVATVEFLQNFASTNNSIFLTREDTGFSHGQFYYVWQMFKDKYDFYLFHEQDFVPCQDNWISMAIQKFLSERNVGAVGNSVEGYRDREYMLEHYSHYFKKEYLGDYWDTATFRHCNMDGHWLLTSSRILSECGLNITYDKTGEVNELIWTHHILNSGYKLLSFDDGTYKSTPGICYVDFNIKSDRYAPLVHGQVLYCNQEMRDHFSWYTELDRFKLYA